MSKKPGLFITGVDFINYIEVAISNGPFFETYTYETSLSLKPGQRVEIDFANRIIVGYVINTGLEKPDFKTKEIRGVIDVEPYLSQYDLDLALYCHRNFLAPVGKVFDLFFPPGKIIQSKKFLLPAEENAPFDKAVSYESGMKKYGEEKIKEWLESNLIKISHSIVQKKSTGKKKQLIKLLCGLNQLKELKLTDQGSQIVNYLLTVDSVEVSELVRTLSLKSRSPINTLEKKGIVEITEEDDSGSSWVIGAVKNLTPQQETAYQGIRNSDNGLHLLHGLTGTGKTEVYFKVMEYYLNKGKQVLYMVPEVSLTPQLMARIRGAFPGREIREYHSYLTKGKRQAIWLDAVEGNADIIVGTRSSVWIPIKNPGIIIVDEEHDGSFYQQSSPHYDGVEIALEKGRLMKIPIILGSATPRVSHYYRALNGEFALHSLTERPVGSLPKTVILNLKNKKTTSAITREALISINETLKKKKQIFVFVHRKGFSNYVVCMSCGHIIKCNNCDVSLTYHKDANALKCHYCGHTEVPSPVCPSCGDKTLVARGFGTEKVEYELRRTFPDIKILRMDRETISEPGEYEKALRLIEKKDAQIVVGTKMIAKGLDFPDVELVVVVDADRLMSLPRYDALENSFQLISQVSGRSGRGTTGTSIIQTFNPEQEVMDFALKNDFTGFYRNEIDIREDLFYPPFSKLIEIVVRNKLENKCEERANQIVEELESLNGSCMIYGPIEPTLKKIQGMSRLIIYVKVSSEKSPDFLLPVIKKYSADIDILVDNIGGIL